MELADLFDIVIELYPKKQLKSKKNIDIDIDEIIQKVDKDFGTVKVGEQEFSYIKKGRYIIFDSVFDKCKYLQKEIEECRKKSHYDGLTGCLTKMETEFIVEKLLKTYIRYNKEPFSLIAMDLDYFKRINDTYGHRAGDYILKEFATIVKSELRESDICGRIGGEEFLILLPNTKTPGAMRLAERIRNKVQKHKFVYKNQRISVTVSIGITSVGLTDSLESLLSRVDEALYDAKSKGRNRVEYR